MPIPVIRADALSVSFHQQRVLSDLSFEVHPGEVFALLGGNGTGKSTTLKTFLGLHAPSAGRAEILGLCVNNNVQAVRQEIAYLPESVMLYGHLTAKENVRYFLALADIIRSELEIEQAFEKVSLQANAWNSPLQNFSKGMRQKTAIALALLRSAPVLLLDEPTSGLDPVAIDEFNLLVSQLAKGGATILMVTHDVYGACQVANRIGLLQSGQLVGSFSRPEQGSIDTEEVHRAFAQRADA